ncbi:insulin-degrading enzyme-like [Acyrthosiphon pisum]|uniref:Peptidase M16 middle/third domain-containing protein n=1 Tax=Acyrthosiphon pisum TaxID=7029 RepID=A0A8R2JKT8_ACYPI|nr:insulin-degrading enzyme-like [Acyrthosiphon pisum]
MDIFVRLFNEDLSQHTCVANRAVLQSKMKSRIFGFNIKFDGFNDKMHHLVKRTIEKLLAFKIDPRRLEIIKEKDGTTVSQCNAVQFSDSVRSRMESF